jgi:hypothetical protein
LAPGVGIRTNALKNASKSHLVQRHILPQSRRPVSEGCCVLEAKSSTLPGVAVVKATTGFGAIRVTMAVSIGSVKGIKVDKFAEGGIVT